ncbi:hypothetical protein LEP1GSC038_3169 [Leptospira weilii str. 2006001855]|uniref:Uncharacterized protein n=1 Tax=Leptospira weilii str. 2006001855 TaxID=996804 RepID=M6FSH6_9LEPT|nr:hypothetical protein LEP1GSC038_3169 [Leptospira weilii str. 2006001855]
MDVNFWYLFSIFEYFLGEIRDLISKRVVLNLPPFLLRFRMDFF